MVPVGSRFGVGAAARRRAEPCGQQRQPASLGRGRALVLGAGLARVAGGQQPLFGRPVAARVQAVAVGGGGFLPGGQAVG